MPRFALRTVMFVAVVALFVTGCVAETAIEDQDVELYTFSGTIDATTGEVFLDSFAPTIEGADVIAAHHAALTQLTEDGDRIRHNAPEGRIELITMSARDVDPDGNPYPNPGMCSADEFCGHIRIDSFFSSSMLVNTFAEITAINDVSYSAVNSFGGSPLGLQSDYGLFRYGTLQAWNGSRTEPGYGRNVDSSAVQQWRFGCPGGQCRLKFAGRIMADVVTLGRPAGAGASSDAPGRNR